MIMVVDIENALAVAIARRLRRYAANIQHIGIPDLPLTHRWGGEHQGLIKALGEVMADFLIVIGSRQSDYLLVPQVLRVKEGNTAIKPRYLSVILRQITAE